MADASATSRIDAPDRAVGAARASPAERARAWLFDACFPFWAERAVHPRGGFRERVALDGGPLDDDVSRVRVQARQTYLFARAALMGWEPARARALAEHGAESLLGPCRRPDGLLGRMVRPGIGLADDQPELYDNAFGVLALAWAASALGDTALLDAADDILARLDASLAHPAGGYHETLPPRAPRRQNPHMHLFEACTALYETSGAARHRERAAGLLTLFHDHFFDPATGHVRERFEEDLTPRAGDGWGPVEPGHAFEWIALLVRHARAAETRPPDLERLYAAALASLDANGFAPLAARADGAPVDGSRRTWSQTETLRAHLAMVVVGDTRAADRARALFDALFAVHLDPAPAGGWVDHVEADGRPRADAITAATGYHLVTAFADVLEASCMAEARDAAHAAP